MIIGLLVHVEVLVEVSGDVPGLGDERAIMIEHRDLVLRVHLEEAGLHLLSFGEVHLHYLCRHSRERLNLCNFTTLRGILNEFFYPANWAKLYLKLLSITKNHFLSCKSLLSTKPSWQVERR